MNSLLKADNNQGKWNVILTNNSKWNFPHNPFITTHWIADSAIRGSNKMVAMNYIFRESVENINDWVDKSMPVSHEENAENIVKVGINLKNFPVRKFQGREGTLYCKLNC